MRALKILVALTTGIFTASSFAADFTQVEQALASLPSAHVGLAVLDPESGEVLYQYQGAQYFHPASTAKLFTSIAAMLSLGGDYQFTTTLNTDRAPQTSITNLYVKFGGDPSFTSADLNNLLASLKQQGINHINGNIILDNTVFDNTLFALGETREDTMWAFGAPTNSIMIDENSVLVQFKQNTAVPEVLATTPALIKVKSKLIWQNDKNLKICSVQSVPDHDNIITLTGCLPVRLGSQIALAIPHPEVYAADLIKQDLKNLNISFKGKIITGSTPASVKVILVTHNSLPLDTLMVHMLKTSDNFYASAITKTMGLQHYGIGSDKAGAVAIQDYLAPYQLPDYKLEDGAGMSFYDLVTPLTLAQLLYHANQDQTVVEFLTAALPVMVVDGTLANFPSTLLKGKIMAKTGTMTDTSALVGFMQTANGRTVIFSLMIDDTPLPNHDLKVLQAKILTGLYYSFSPQGERE